MKINAINATMFGNRQGIAKKAAAATYATAGSALAADTFVKGLSKPVKEVDEIIKANDDIGENPSDYLSDNCCD
mgnify:CR=1 FL=1